MHSPEQARQEMVVVDPQTVIVQRWVPWWSGQSSHRWKNWHESDFAGRAAAAVRRNAQASSKALDLFMSVISLGWEPRHGAPTQDGAADAVRRDRSSLYPDAPAPRPSWAPTLPPRRPYTRTPRTAYSEILPKRLLRLFDN